MSFMLVFPSVSIDISFPEEIELCADELFVRVTLGFPSGVYESTIFMFVPVGPFVRDKDVPRTPKLTSSESIVNISPERSGFNTRVHIVHRSTTTLILEIFGVDISTLESSSSLKMDSSENIRVTLELLSVSILYHEYRDIFSSPSFELPPKLWIIT
jgi:hypothetical protein